MQNCHLDQTFGILSHSPHHLRCHMGRRDPLGCLFELICELNLWYCWCFRKIQRENQLRPGSWNPIMYHGFFLHPRWLTGVLNHQQYVASSGLNCCPYPIKIQRFRCVRSAKIRDKNHEVVGFQVGFHQHPISTSLSSSCCRMGSPDIQNVTRRFHVNQKNPSDRMGSSQGLQKKIARWLRPSTVHHGWWGSPGFLFMKVPFVSGKCRFQLSFLFLHMVRLMPLFKDVFWSEVST